MKESETCLKKMKTTPLELLGTLSEKLQLINMSGNVQNDIDSLLIELSSRLTEVESQAAAVTEDSYLQYGVPKNNRDKIYVIRVSAETGQDLPNTFHWCDIKLEDLATYTSGIKDGREWSSWKQNYNGRFVRGTFKWIEEDQCLDV